MKNPVSLSWADKIAIFGLTTAAIGIFLQIFSNVANVSVPVGAIVMLVLATLIVLQIWRWTTTVAGVIAVVIFFIGTFIAPGLTNRLSTPSNLGPFVGTVLQLLGLLIAIVASSIATIKRFYYRSQVAEAPQFDRE